MKDKFDITENSSGSFELPQENAVIDNQTPTFFNSKQKKESSNPPEEIKDEASPEYETVVIKINCCSLF